MSHSRLVRTEDFIAEVEVGGHTVIFDEPEKVGGTDTAPSPAAMLGAALTACTILTLRMYAERKGWNVDDVKVEVDTEWSGPRPSGYRVRLEFPDDLDEEQVRRLKVIAGKCPVHRTLADAMPIEVV